MDDLTPEQRERLVEAASAARQHARAPYSSFAVGAAVIDSEDRIHVGCNVENASYGLSICAERHAVAAAVAAGGAEIKGLAVVTATSPPTPPCGACRQVLVEFGDYPVILANPQGECVTTTVHDLLPNAFTRESLVKGQE